MNPDEIRDLTPEGYPVITRHLWRIGETPGVTLPSGSVAYDCGKI
jgi:hypothetical protein